MHDFDLGYSLKLLKKLGYIDSVKIFGVPMKIKEDEAFKQLEDAYLPVYLEEVARAAHARVVGPYQLLYLVLYLLPVLVDVLLDKLQRSSPCLSGSAASALLCCHPSPFLSCLSTACSTRCPWRLDQSYALPSFTSTGSLLLLLELVRLQKLNGMVYAVQYLYRLGQVVVVHVLRRKCTQEFRRRPSCRCAGSPCSGSSLQARRPCTPCPRTCSLACEYGITTLSSNPSTLSSWCLALWSLLSALRRRNNPL